MDAGVDLPDRSHGRGCFRPGLGSGGGKTVAAGLITVDNTPPTESASGNGDAHRPSVVSSMSLEGRSDRDGSPVSSVITFNFKPGQMRRTRGDLRPARDADRGGREAEAVADIGGGHGGGGGHGILTIGSGGLGGEGRLMRLARMGVAPIAFAFAALGMILLAAPIRVRRLIPITASVLILGAILMQAGCGGGSSGGSSPPPPVKGTSEQNATQVWVSSAGGSLAVTGLPASLGTVSVR